jgi:hypothetical protein
MRPGVPEGRRLVLRYLIAIVLVAHGIGHSLGILQTLRLATVNPTWNGDSWLLSGVAGSTVVNAVGMALWSAALIGFVLAGGVVIGWLPAEWWRPLAVGASLCSLAGILLFPVAFPIGSTIAALVVDLVVLGAVLLADWAPSDLAA